MQIWKDYQYQHSDRFLKELFDILRIPSISADSIYKDEVKRCAEVIKDLMLNAGADRAEVCETAGHPIVYCEKIVSPKLPTVLVYGHYDVQPADPLHLWDNPPFEPVIKNGKIFARGACDDKGQMFMHIKALEIMVRTGVMPCNMKMIIEGEEEIGSTNLGTFLVNNRDKVKADVVLVSDTSMISMDNPSIESGLRGLAYMEVEVIGPNRDLHSGVFGGAVANPATILCKMISSLHDENNSVTIPGFYDSVVKLNTDERNAINSAPFDINQYKNELNIDDVWGEKGYTTLERTGIRPTLEVNGIWSGYIGEGAKTVLPSKANAKISMRLVPNQNSEEIAELFRKHIEKITPASVKVTVTAYHGGEAVVTPINSPSYKAAAKAINATFGREPVPTRGGGSIPIVALFERTLGLKTVLFGFGLDSDNIHSPNEKFDVYNFYKGIETIPYFYYFFAEAMREK